MEDDIRNKFSGDFKSMAGLETNESSLIRLCITRCEVYMLDIKIEFYNKYSETLNLKFIKVDTSGIDWITNSKETGYVPTLTEICFVFRGLQGSSPSGETTDWLSVVLIELSLPKIQHIF